MLNEFKKVKLTRGYFKCPKCDSNVFVTQIDDKEIHFLCKNEECKEEFVENR